MAPAFPASGRPADAAAAPEASTLPRTRGVVARTQHDTDSHNARAGDDAVCKPRCIDDVAVDAARFCARSRASVSRPRGTLGPGVDRDALSGKPAHGRDRAQQPSASSVDAFPPLRRPLAQLAHETPTQDTDSADAADLHRQAAAERLLASRGFLSVRLRRAMDDVHELAQRNGAFRLVDNRKAHEALSGNALHERYRETIVEHASHHLRIDANTRFRRSVQDSLQSNLREVRESLLDELRAHMDPAKAIPKPFTYVEDTNDTASARGAKRPMTSPERSASRVRVAPSPMKPGTPNTQNVVAVDPDFGYLYVVRDYLTRTDPPDMLAARLFECAAERAEHPHFLQAMSALARRCTLCSTSDEDSEDSVRVPSSREVVLTALEVLEDAFAEMIGSVPVNRADRSASAVRAGVEKYVGDLVRMGSLRPAEFDSSPRTEDGYALPIWPQVYYCLRCGSPEAALEIVEICSDHSEVAGLYYSSYLRAFIERRARAYTGADADHDELARDAAANDDMAAEYWDSVDQSHDVYFRACYVLLARSEHSSWQAFNNAQHGGNRSVPYAASASRGSPVLVSPDSARIAGLDGAPRGTEHIQLRDEDHDALFGSVEDFMWLRLWQCLSNMNTADEHTANVHPTMPLEQLQTEVLSWGPRHFDPSGQAPMLYAFVLVLVGLAWNAVEYLAVKQNVVCPAYAAYLALPQYAVSWQPSDTQCASVLWGHIIHFAADFPVDAALLLFAIRDMDVLSACLERLVRDAGHHKLLLGDGAENEGMLQRIADELENSSHLESGPQTVGRDLGEQIRSAREGLAGRMAEELLTSWRTEKRSVSGSLVAMLFRVAGNASQEHHAVLMYACEQAMAQPETPARQEARELATELLDRLRGAEEAEEAPADDWPGDKLQRSLTLALQAMTFFDQFRAGRNADAWASLLELGVIPVDTRDIPSRQHAFSEASEVLFPCVGELLPDVLRASLELVEAGLSPDRATVEWDPQVPRPLPSQALAIATFAGVMGFGETELNARLVQLELLLA